MDIAFSDDDSTASNGEESASSENSESTDDAKNIENSNPGINMKNSIESNDRAKDIENGDLDKASIDTVQSKQKSEDRSILSNNNINTSNKVESKETPHYY
jgi:hypothetical protein